MGKSCVREKSGKAQFSRQVSNPRQPGSWEVGKRSKDGRLQQGLEPRRKPLRGYWEKNILTCSPSAGDGNPPTVLLGHDKQRKRRLGKRD